MEQVYYQWCISALNFEGERIRINKQLYNFLSRKDTFEFAKHLQTCGYTCVRVISEKVVVLEVVQL